MFMSFWAIVSNTFKETLRQPVYGVVVGATLLLLVASPSMTMFTMDNDNQLLKDIGLSTLLMAGLLLAVFSASSVVTDEIENKTVLTVVSKTIHRSTFIIGKFLGISGAVIFAEYFLALVLLMVVRHGVMQTARDEPDVVVIMLGCTSLAFTLLFGLAGNYFYNFRFGSTSITLGALLATIVTGILIFIDPQGRYNPQESNLAFHMVGPILLVFLAVLSLTAIAVTAAIRMNLVTTLLFCFIIFLLGAMVPYWIAPVIAKGGIYSHLAQLALALLPNINHFIVTNAVYEGIYVPLNYIGITALYALLYVSGILLFAISLIRGRELG